MRPPSPTATHHVGVGQDTLSNVARTRPFRRRHVAPPSAVRMMVPRSPTATQVRGPVHAIAFRAAVPGGARSTVHDRPPSRVRRIVARAPATRHVSAPGQATPRNARRTGAMPITQRSPLSVVRRIAPRCPTATHLRSVAQLTASNPVRWPGAGCGARTETVAAIEGQAGAEHRAVATMSATVWGPYRIRTTPAARRTAHMIHRKRLSPRTWG